MSEKDFKELFANIKNDMKNLSSRNLVRMRSFYKEYKDFVILPVVLAKLPWTHNYTLIEKLKDREKRFWYANEVANGN